MTAIGSNYDNGCLTHTLRKLSPRLLVVGFIAMAILATATIAISSWANVKIVASHGAAGILKYSPYSIALPVALNLIFISTAVALVIEINRRSPPTTTQAVAPTAANQVLYPTDLKCQTVQAPIAGTCKKINVKVGDRVEANTVICVIESMKMELSMRAGAQGVVKEIFTGLGCTLESGASLFSLQH